MDARTFDSLREEARSRLLTWSSKDRALFAELLEDARSDLQRELLERALAAEHTPAELHAFADALRPLRDSEAFEACTLDLNNAPGGYAVDELFRAEGDPLFAYSLRGAKLFPSGTRGKSTTGMPGVGRAPAVREHLFPHLSRKLIGESDEVIPRASPQEPSVAAPAPKPEATAELFADLINGAVEALGLSYVEHEVDGDGLVLEQALPQMTRALQRGFLIPAAIGPAQGKSGRLVLVLQASVSGKRRAFQFLDPSSQEVVWVNEGDLLARTELPFANKRNHLLTRVALPEADRQD